MDCCRQQKQSPPTELVHPFLKSIDSAETERKPALPLSERTRPEDLLATDMRVKTTSIPFSGSELSVELQATSEVPEPWLNYLLTMLEVTPADPKLSTTGPSAGIHAPMGLRRGEREIALTLKSSKPPIELSKLAWKWPDGFVLVRPGVLALALDYEGVPEEPTVVASQMTAMNASGPTIEKALLCKPTNEEALPIRFAEVKLGDWSNTTDADGKLEVPESLIASESFDVVYEGSVSGSKLQVMNDLHASRSDPIPGDWIVKTIDCELWIIGTEVLEEFRALRGQPPPSDGFRIKRWAGVAVGVPYAFYDYVVVGTNLLSFGWALRNVRRGTLYHEFGHTVAFVADGEWNHWLNDATKWTYPRFHSGTQITIEPFAWSEGWANFWECSRTRAYQTMDAGVPAAPGETVNCPSFGDDHPPPDFMDWNEDRLAERLGKLAHDIGDPYEEMVAILEANDGQIHSLHEFESAYCAATSSPSYCANGVPTRAKEDCPPGFSKLGSLCQRHEAIDKPRQGRGTGVLPIGCEEAEDEGIALCYAPCDAGYTGVGPVCWEDCPNDYDGGGAFCRKDVHIVSSDNSSCPWYDKCGVTFAAGCSTCPDEYDNDGCTCRRPAHIYAKDTRPRGLGEPKTDCPDDMEYDAGRCYPPCPQGFSGVGPTCWGQCPDLYQDWGASCHFIETFAVYSAP